MRYTKHTRRPHAAARLRRRQRIGPLLQLRKTSIDTTSFDSTKHRQYDAEGGAKYRANASDKARKGPPKGSTARTRRSIERQETEANSAHTETETDKQAKRAPKAEQALEAQRASEAQRERVKSQKCYSRSAGFAEEPRSAHLGKC
ncbi:hypothetical protein ON010_g16545 [Phytophthora cinnamomi]|nr:hypothetical protein ON010_g16545 [Phytophthora cinnamomi]